MVISRKTTCQTHQITKDVSQGWYIIVGNPETKHVHIVKDHSLLDSLNVQMSPTSHILSVQV